MELDHKPDWSHQDRAIDLLRAALRTGSKRPVLQLPTGAGKTRIASRIVSMALAKGNRVIFTVPAISLIDQTARAFWDEGIREVGIIQGSHAGTNPRMPVQIASVQTLAKRTIPEAQLVLVDEAHRMSQFVTDWLGREDWANVPFIGLSATPWTKGMGRLYDRLIIGATTKELIDAGVLCPFRVFAPSKPDLSKVRTVADDFHEGDLAKVMIDKSLTADIVQTWLDKADGRPTLVFAVDRAHAAHLQEAFEFRGIRAGYIDATTPLPDRENVKRQLDRGQFQVVCNVGVLTTGVDWDIRCIVLARPTKSESLFVQIVGRGLRTAPGKADLLLLDHSDTTIRLGFVTDIHHPRLSEARLNAGEAQVLERAPPKPRECKACSFVIPQGVRACPNCGHEAKRPSEVEVREGELVELGAHRETKAAKKRNDSDDWLRKIAFIAELRCYALEKGRKEAWVAHKYRDFYGVWPNDPKVRYAKPAHEVSPEVRSWIHAMNVRWAKAQGKAK